MKRGAGAGDGTLRRTAIILGMVALAILLLAILVLGIRIFLAAFGGVLAGILLNAFARSVEARTPLGYGAALTAVVLALLLGLGGLSWLAAPQIAEQAQELGEELPEIVRSIEESLEEYPLGRWVLEQARTGGVPGAEVDGDGVLSVLGDVSTYLLVAILVALFGAGNPGLYRRALLHLVPLDRRRRAAEMLDEVVTTLRWWLIGQAIAMVLIGVSTGVMLALFGLPFAILLGVVVGLLGFVPFLGPIAGTVPVALVALTEGATILLWVLVAYTAIQMLEGYVAMPLIQQRTVYLPPVFTILAQIVAGTMIGVIGVIMATPLAAVALVLTRYYRSDILGDTEVEEAERRR